MWGLFWGAASPEGEERFGVGGLTGNVELWENKGWKDLQDLQLQPSNPPKLLNCAGGCLLAFGTFPGMMIPPLPCESLPLPSCCFSEEILLFVPFAFDKIME